MDPSFKELFDLAVDRAMLALGESGRQATYYHIEKTFGIKRKQWHKEPENFAEALEKIFGPGAQLLFKAITKELYSNLGLKLEEEKRSHFTYVVRKAEHYAEAIEKLKRKQRRNTTT
ncbi:MAG: hypothetical protein QMD13_04715 [Candidatus Bathyarchaeia archaeon]|nr:hypothetical protein [Candidatus Bathyarchaeia archaeon]